MKAHDLKAWLATVPDEAIIEIGGRYSSYFEPIKGREIRARVPEQVFTLPPEPDGYASA